MTSEYSGRSGSQRRRASRPELFMEIARLFGRRSSCPRAEVGCIAVLEGRVIASGYVGAPQGQDHCDQVGCALENGHCIRSVHAEANLVAWAARTGTSLLGSTLWCTYSPCHACAKLIAQAGIEALVYDSLYDHMGLNLLRQLGVRVVQYDNEPR